MARTDIRITPSPQARHLFNQMAARSDNLHIDLINTLELAVERKRAGLNDTHEIHELEREEWIDRAPDGGWLLH